MIGKTILILAALLGIAGVAGADLTGIWAFWCEDDQLSKPLPLAEFTAAIRSQGPAISGACTGESPNPWNGMVTGRLEEGKIDLVVLLIQHPMVVGRMIGTVDGSGDIAGAFVSSDEEGSGWRGNFSGRLTTPDLSLYEPAAPEPLPFVPAVAGGISDFREGATAPPVEEAPKRRTVQVIGYTRDTIYSRPVM